MILVVGYDPIENNAFTRKCAKKGIIVYYSSAYRPQSNGELEVTNKAILQALKKMVEQPKGSWANQLFEIVWVYVTIVKTQQNLPSH